MRSSFKTALISLFVFVAAAAVSAQKPSLSDAIDKIFTDGLAAYNAKDYDRAIDRYTVYLRIGSNDQNALYNRGLAYFQKAEYVKAADDLSKAIGFDAQYADAYIQRGRTYIKLALGDEQKYSPLAAADFSKAIELKPNTGYLYRERSEAYFRIHDTARALADINDAIRLGERDAEAYYLRGRIKFDEHKYAEADPDFREALRLDPRHAAAGAMLETNAARLTKAAESSSPAVASAKPAPAAVFPKAPQASATSAVGGPSDEYIEKGKSYLAANRPDDAIAAFQQALANLPKQPELVGSFVSIYISNEKANIRRYIAKAYLQKQDPAESIRQCSELESEVLKGLVASYKTIKMPPPDLVEGIEVLLVQYDTLKPQAKKSVEIAEDCVSMHKDLPAANDHRSDLWNNELASSMIARTTVELFGVASQFNLKLLRYCNENGSEDCGPHSKTDKTKKYRSDAFSYINSAIEILPSFRPSYAIRAELYRYLGQNELAAADEAKANEP